MTNTLRVGNVEVGRIGLGTNRLTNTPKNVEFIRDAVEAGVSHIDTAYLYTRGESEETIGAALNPIPDGVVVATKGGYNPGEGRPAVLRSQIEESLRRLRTEVISLYYLHRVDPETPLEESLGVIAEYRDRGRIRNVGISDVSVEQIRAARQVVPIAAVQNQYSLSERKHDDVVDYCAERRHPVRSLLPAARRLAGARRHRRRPRRNARADRARLAAAPLIDDPADPGHAHARAPAGEPRRGRSRAD